MIPSFDRNSKVSKPISEHRTIENDVHRRIRLTLSFQIRFKVVGNGSVDRFVRRYFVRASDYIVSLQAGIFKSRYVRYTPLPAIDHSLDVPRRGLQIRKQIISKSLELIILRPFRVGVSDRPDRIRR